MQKYFFKNHPLTTGHKFDDLGGTFLPPMA